MVERRAFGRGDGVRNHLRRFETRAISFIPLCLCLSEETVKDVGPFYLLSREMEKTCDGFTCLEKDTLKNQEDHIGNKCNYALMCYPRYHWIPKQINQSINQINQNKLLNVVTILGATLWRPATLRLSPYLLYYCSMTLFCGRRMHCDYTVCMSNL